uniref:Putative secreted protein n=1 Tax=Anopheles darlingi TaxID=43151 RepID=A0A2M4DI41_ANODA
MYMYFVLTCHSTVFGLHLPVCFFRTLIFGRSTAHTHQSARQLLQPEEKGSRGLGNRKLKQQIGYRGKEGKRKCIYYV